MWDGQGSLGAPGYTVVGWVMAPKYIQVLIHKTVNVTLYGERDFANMIKGRILRWGEYPGLYGWALNATTTAFIRGR